MRADLIQAMKKLIWFEINGKLHTSIPAIVSKYDPVKVKVEAQPIIKKLYEDGTELAYKAIPGVPVMFPRTNRFHMTYPLEVGDMVLLIFSERSIGNWLNTDEEAIPGDDGKYSMNDAVAIPGLYAFNKGSKIKEKNNLEIVLDNVTISTDGKDFKLDNGSAVIESNGDQVKINNDGLTVD